MIALIGEKEIWRGFVPLGVTIFEAETRAEIIEAIEKIKADKFMFVLVSDETARKIEDLLNDFCKKMNIVLLPALDSDTNKQQEQLYFRRLKALTEKAMGVDILS